MYIAKLWAKITIQERSATVDDIGQPSTTWSDVTTDFADLRHMRGMETVRADAATSSIKASFRIRNRPSLTVNAGMRVLHENMVYNILAVLPQDTRNRYLDIVCERQSDIPIGD